VARLYRALELLAQTRLKKREPTLDTSNLNLDLLPVALQPKYTALRQQLAENGQDGKLQIGLWRAYGLLVDLGDPLGSVFSDHYSTLLDALQQRNASILAHGVQPVSRTDYDALERRFFAFFQAGLQALGEKFTGVQFPIIGESGMTQRQTTF
jgi:CRISPR-associated protein (TIGR02710 family)